MNLTKKAIQEKVNSINDEFRKNQAIDNIAYSFAGNRYKKERQKLLLELTGQSYPVAKSGIHEIVKVIKEICK